MIYPELNETTTAAIEYVCSYSRGFSVTTNLELKGKGIKQTGDGSDHKRNMKTYHVSELAMSKLKESYNTCYIASL